MSEIQPMPEKITDPVAVWPTYFREPTADDTTQNIPILTSDTLTLDEPITTELPKYTKPNFHLPHLRLPHLEKHITHTWRRGAIACAAAIGVGMGGAFISDQLTPKKVPQATESHEQAAAKTEATEEKPTTKPTELPPVSTPAEQERPQPYAKTVPTYHPKATRKPEEVPSFRQEPQANETSRAPSTPAKPSSTPPETTPATPTPESSSSGQSSEPAPTSPPTQTETPNTPSPVQSNPQTSPEVQISSSASEIETPATETHTQQTPGLHNVSATTERPETPEVSQSPSHGG